MIKTPENSVGQLRNFLDICALFELINRQDFFHFFLCSSQSFLFAIFVLFELEI